MTGSTVSYSGVIGPGQTLPIALTGTDISLVVATAPLFLRPTGQVWNLFQPGTGMRNQPQFAQVEVYNQTTNAVTFQLLASFGDFVDRRLLPNLQLSSVVLPASWTFIAGTEFYAQLVDKSGSLFTDANGLQWNAVSRQAISIQVFSGGSTPPVYSLYAYSDLVPDVTVPPLAMVQGTTAGGLPSPTMFALNGNYSVKLVAGTAGTTNVAGSVFEIYTALAPGYAGNPPN